jgi:hypothetical protein
MKEVTTVGIDIAKSVFKFTGSTLSVMSLPT